MKFQIFNRWTGKLRVEVEIAAEFEGQPRSVQLGAAVKAAIALNADLSLANLREADLSAANLREADLSLADLSLANLREADLSLADLSLANLSAANLREANLREADLSEADLSLANLREADLSLANLSEANLSEANLSDILPLVRVPSLNRQILAAIDAGGGLDMESWHTCDTTHCRAGWAVHLAGPTGRVLEYCYGSAAAGALIYLASCPFLDGKTPNFYADNEDALADIRRCAELEPELEAK